jgi:predicted acetyltransferase
MNIDSVIIRPMIAEEVEAVATLQVAGFGGDIDLKVHSLQNNPRHDLSHIIVAEYEGSLIGTATVFPAKMWLSGVPVNLGAVAAVTVLPEFRQQGVSAKIMKFAIIWMYSNGYAMSALFPFSHRYYRGFGYGIVSDLHVYRFHRDNLDIEPENTGYVRPFTPDDLGMMRVIYKGQSTWHNGWFTRSNDWWNHLINRWPNIVVFDNDGTIEGYCAYAVVTKNDERVLSIKEFFAGEAVAFRGLLNFLANQNEAEVIEYLAPADTPLRYSLRQPIAADARNHGWIFNDLCYVATGPMARIINLPKALTTRFYTRGISGERIIKVTDPLIPSNETPVVFRLVDGRAETRFADDAQPQVETDITTFTQVLCGYMKAIDAYRLGRFKADEDSCTWLDKIIADAPLYIQQGDWF